MTNPCLVPACDPLITRAGHALGYPHWKAHRAGKIKTCPACNPLHEADLCPRCDENPALPLGPASLTDPTPGARHRSPQRPGPTRQSPTSI